MATARQIKYRMEQAKKKLNQLNKEVAVTKSRMKSLEAHLKKNKAAEKAKPKAKRRSATGMVKCKGPGGGRKEI